ncbi:MAG: hypothetical protein KC502_18965 [Myxococcales bacterium]|nr:hypothetical protein [Myxococcales bacterium]
MGQRQTIGAGSEIEVGAPATPLVEPLEVALRDVVQGMNEIAFACLPVIAFPQQPPSEVLVIFLRRGVSPEAVLTIVSDAVQRSVEAVLAEHPAIRAPELAVLPVSLGHPLDGLAQAVVQSDTVLHVADPAAWAAAKKPPRPLWLRILWPWGR